MIGIAEAAQAAPETWLDSLGPLVALASLLWGGWQTIRAARKAALLRAAIVGVRAGLDALAHEDAEAVKGAIKSAAGPLEPALKAEVRKTTSSMPAYREDGLPKLLLLTLLLPVLLSACVSGAIHTSAVEAQTSARILRAASIADPRYSEAEKQSYERLWSSHEAALRAIEESSK